MGERHRGERQSEREMKREEGEKGRERDGFVGGKRGSDKGKTEME